MVWKLDWLKQFTKVKPLHFICAYQRRWLKSTCDWFGPSLFQSKSNNFLKQNYAKGVEGCMEYRNEKMENSLSYLSLSIFWTTPCCLTFSMQQLPVQSFSQIDRWPPPARPLCRVHSLTPLTVPSSSSADRHGPAAWNLTVKYLFIWNEV